MYWQQMLNVESYQLNYFFSMLRFRTLSFSFQMTKFFVNRKNTERSVDKKNVTFKPQVQTLFHVFSRIQTHWVIDNAIFMFAFSRWFIGLPSYSNWVVAVSFCVIINVIYVSSFEFHSSFVLFIIMQMCSRNISCCNLIYAFKYIKTERNIT